GYKAKTYGQTKGWTKRWLEDRHYTSGAKSKIKLLKLHGSLNWELYRTGTAIRLKPRPYLVSTRSGKTRFEKILILAPGWKKEINRNPYKQFWRTARLELEKCKTLVILGYSLPETDLLAQSLLAEVVRTRAARKVFLKQLHLADHNDSVKDRFVALFTPALGPHGKVFKYHDIAEFNQKHKRGSHECDCLPVVTLGKRCARERVDDIGSFQPADVNSLNGGASVRWRVVERSSSEHRQECLCHSEPFMAG